MNIASIFKWRSDVSRLKFFLNCVDFVRQNELCAAKNRWKWAQCVCHFSLLLVSNDYRWRQWRWPFYFCFWTHIFHHIVSGVCREMWSQWHQWLWNRQQKRKKVTNDDRRIGECALILYHIYTRRISYLLSNLPHKILPYLFALDLYCLISFISFLALSISVARPLSRPFSFCLSGCLRVQHRHRVCANYKGVVKRS